MTNLSIKFDKIYDTLDKEKFLNTKLQTENKAIKIKIKELFEGKDSYKNKSNNNETVNLNEKLSEISIENKNLKIKNKELYNSSVKHK